MTNAELIKALRCCGHNMIFHYCDKEDCQYCQYSYYEDLHICNVQELGIDAADALEAADKRIAELEAQEPTEKQVVDYCHKRCLVIVEGELFQRMKSTFSQRPKEGEWIVTTEVSDDGAVTSHINCSRCGFYWREPKHGKVFKRCPNCGARMKGANDEN